MIEHGIVAVLVLVAAAAGTCAQMFYRAAERAKREYFLANQRQQAAYAALEHRLEEAEVKWKTEQGEREYYEKLARTFEKEVLAIAAGRG